MTTLNPQTIADRLCEIEEDLAERETALGDAARKWFIAKRDRERHRAEVFLASEGTVAERQAHADMATAMDGKEAEAEWEALRAVTRTLETRASIGQSLLKTYGRAA